MLTWYPVCIIQHMSARAMLFQTDAKTGNHFFCKQGVLGGSSSLFKVFALEKTNKKNDPGLDPSSML